MAHISHEENWDRVPDEELEETIWERIEGLKDMFPQPVVKGATVATNWSKWFAASSFWLTKNAIWIMATTGMIMILPYLLEKENADAQKKENEHQRQVLLGPSSAVASAKATQ